MWLFSRRPWLCAVAPVMLACGDHPALEERAAAAVGQRLIGVWDVRFELERSPLLTSPNEPVVRVVRGLLAFVANRGLDASYPQMPAATDYGTYDIDFMPFGFEPRSAGQTPTAVAGVIGDDSIQIMLDPEPGRSSVTMRGEIVGDSIVGTWNVSIARVGGGGGKFIMMRHRGDDEASAPARIEP